MTPIDYAACALAVFAILGVLYGALGPVHEGGRS